MCLLRSLIKEREFDISVQCIGILWIKAQLLSFILLLSLYLCFSHTTETLKVTGWTIHPLNPFLFMYHRDQLARFISFSTPILKVGNQLAHHQVGQMAAIVNPPLFVLLVQFNRLTSRGHYWIFLICCINVYIYVCMFLPSSHPPLAALHAQGQTCEEWGLASN